MLLLLFLLYCYFLLRGEGQLDVELLPRVLALHGQRPLLVEGHCHHMNPRHELSRRGALFELIERAGRTIG